jgi:hypothetical protein
MAKSPEQPPLSRRLKSAKSRPPKLSPGRPSPDGARGRKFHRTGGGRTQIDGIRLSRDAPKGPVVSPHIQYEESFRRPATKPITKAAINLLDDYLRRRSFWEAVKLSHIPLEMAAWAHLRVKERRGQEVLAELDRFGSPLRWFQDQVAAKVNAGTIGTAPEVEPSPEADAFYLSLAGGPARLEDLQVKSLGLRSQVWVGEFAVRPRYPDDEVILYLIYKHIRSRAGSKTGRRAAQ